VLSIVPDPACATRSVVSPGEGTPAGTVVIASRDLRFRGDGTVLAGGQGPRSGELALLCRPVVTAPAVVRRDGTLAAGAWLPDLVRLGELEAHLGDGVIEEAVAAALDAGRLPRRLRRRIMSYPLVIRLMIAMSLMPDVILSFRVSRGCDLRRPVVDSVAGGTLAAWSRLFQLSGSLLDRVRADRWSPSA
jgi:hypothetical protein